MTHSIWTYPWDILNIGIQETYRDIFQTANLNSISLALSYHAGRTIQPRNPRQHTYFLEDGTLYFEPTMEHYQLQRIQPQTVSYGKDCDALLRQLQTDSKSMRFRLSGWFVCLHNTRIGTAYPEATTVNAFGNGYPYALCPSNPINRTYITTVLHDLTHKYDLDAIELESLSFMGFPHGGHHEIDGVGLNEYENFLLSLCFCDSCQSLAEEHRIPINAVRKYVKQELEEAFSREIPKKAPESFLMDGMEYFRHDEAFYAYLTWRTDVVTTLAAEVRRAIHPRTECLMITSPPDKSWRVGIDVRKVSTVLDGILMCLYDMDPSMVANQVKTVRQWIPATKKVFAGFRVFYPEVSHPDVLKERVQNAKDCGADGVNFYNYGLIPEPRLQWMNKSIL